MIEEQFVSFETAKLLKEAGFNEPCRYNYDNVGGFRWFKIGEPTPKGWVPCPTQALAARWLREVHHYAICVWFTKDYEKWFYAHGDMDNMAFDTDYNISEFIFDSYEEAFEAGLQEAIKLIRSKDHEDDNVQ